MGEAKGGNRTILVAGGGIAGMSAAVEAAEAGFPVILVEREASLGGRVAGMKKYFPKFCPPACGLEINFRRIRSNPLIRVLTMSEVEKIKGEAGDFTVAIRLRPRYVNEKCTACGKCSETAVTRIPNPFDYGLSTLKAAYLPHEFAYPMRYVIDPRIIGTPEAAAVEAACGYGAVDLDMVFDAIEVEAGAIIWATGWTPFDACAIPRHGAGKLRNVITNVVLERLASRNGPTGGILSRPSDRKALRKIAFVQCAGSRDENFLPYCSGVCCLASLKQAIYMLKQDRKAQITIFCTDIRVPGNYEAQFKSIEQEDGITLVRGKVEQITEDPQTGLVAVVVENQATRKILRDEFELVVLAAGMVPNTARDKIPAPAAYDEYGFLSAKGNIPGIFGAGCATSPSDVASSVQGASAAVLRAIQVCRSKD
ncbi:MAG: FAD-dependent oxidoreductase [Syntrophobacteraceae bacterium]|nr:FAD-dependent oxidoreductase [Syntrophobacteraceae bacterium]